jgi:hypothetical protein
MDSALIFGLEVPHPPPLSGHAGLLALIQFGLRIWFYLMGDPKGT